MSPAGGGDEQTRWWPPSVTLLPLLLVGRCFSPAAELVVTCSMTPSPNINGDVGRVEYLLMTADADFDYRKFASVFGEAADGFRCAVYDYLSTEKKMACDIHEVLADGLKVHPREAFSKLLKDEESDSIFRLNRYPPCTGAGDSDPIGFRVHTTHKYYRF
ncbi:gibberellin 2-oxidase 2 [Striga asiatica]|uniref:Gibberellin 2-oxidase 2 n=1 Tax=Striga asiatica TaxID=4170 RepID=A0A5A7PWX8_STRAF|nr:gibberellin 2-oxidase 2 [Striga asiatica]